MANKELPVWATVGATVLLEPGSYRRETKFIECTVSRVTKTSVFIVTPGGHERRFVNTGWVNDGDRMTEYGRQGSGYSPVAYIWNPEAESVRYRRVLAAKKDRLDAIATAADDLARAARQGMTDEKITELTLALYGAVNDYEASKP